MDRATDGDVPPPRVAGREDLERPGVLRQAAMELGALAAAKESSPARLRELAAPDALDVLFRVALGTAVRRGPRAAAEVGSPAGILALAAAAARAGALPLATVAALRDGLERVADELRRSGAWSEAAPLWWSPLPEPDRLERLWRELGSAEAATGAWVGAPPAEGAREILSGAGDGGRLWLAWPGALPPPLLKRLHGELATWSEGGGLALRSAGVGRSKRRSERRNDEVRYLTGLEPDLLSGAPTLAVVVQHLLDRVEPGLRALLPNRPVHAPQTAMLARYSAPNAGFAAHLDNPGGDDDNGRALSLVLYLNPPDRPCRGGDLALWPAGPFTEDEPPAVVLPPDGGSAVLFDARSVPHAVTPLEPGPDRWTLVLWLSEEPRRPPRPLVPVPDLRTADVLRAVADPPVAPGTVLFRRVAPAGASALRPAPGRRPRAGLVATVREAGETLETWCRHHLALGFDRILLVLDGPEGSAGGDDAEALRALRRSPGGDRVEVWSPAEAGAHRRSLQPFDGRDDLFAAAERGTATWAVAARQALNATAALAAARAAGLDWLVHLDADELLVLEGAGRGGATLAEHFAAAEAAGWPALRYLNHELLLPWRPGEALRFKRNPAQAAELLGPGGWRQLARHLAMEQGDRRPYFRAYWNGKGAAAVAAASHAAGVHGWHVPGAPEAPLLAGPSVLHLHLPTAGAFRRKYLRVAEAEGSLDDPIRPFPPSALERAAVERIGAARSSGAPAGSVAASLEALYAETTWFAPREIELLEAAELLWTPSLPHVPTAAPAASAIRD